MAAISGTEAQVTEVIGGMGESISLAALNGPEQTVVSGLGSVVDEAIAKLSAAGLRATKLTVSHAFHSALMEPMLLEFTEVASKLSFSAPTIPFISDHDGSVLDGDRVKDPLYWRDHVRQAIRFTDAMAGMDEQGIQLFLEIGPQPVLTGMGRRCLPDSDAVWLPSLRKGRDDQKMMLTSVAEASVNGVGVDWVGFEGERATRKLDLPVSPMNKRRFWAEERTSTVEVLSVTWDERPAVAADLAGDWLVLGGWDELTAGIEAAGGRVVSSGEVRGVVDARALGGGTAEDLVSAAVTTLKTASAPVFLVTNGAVAVSDGDLVSADQSALWGLGRAFAQEKPAEFGGLVDVDGEDDVAAILAELGQTGREQVAWRGGRRRVARLAVTEVVEERLSISDEGTYLVTGGLGDLGLHVARWLVANGARSLVLTSRRGLRTSAVDELESSGATVKVEAVDVADVAGMASLAARTTDLRGIVHAAGVVERVGLDELDADGIKRMLAAKVAGSRVIDAITKKRELDFVVFFSSVSALWGGQGLLAYAAANAFQDGLAERRAADGLAGLSIGWGVWGGGGMATEDERAALARMGLGALDPASALRRMGAVLSRSGHVGIADVDWTRLQPILSARGPAPLFAGLGAKASTASGPAVLLEQLLGLPADERRGALIKALRDEVRAVGELGDAPIPLDAGFFDLGLDSLMAVEMKSRMEDKLGRGFPATLLMDQPDLGRLVDWLMAELDFSGAQTRVRADVGRSDEPIAVVGMACKLPGGANSPDALWELLNSGRDAVREVPSDRWDIDAWYDAAPETAGKMYARRGGFVDGVDLFDAGFFGITAREAKRMDPQHRMLLETSWQALENAGLSPARSGTMTSGGVFVGIGSGDYLSKVIGSLPAEQVDAWTGTGNAMAFAAGRLAFHLGLQGPALALDTACSSSLVATHLACQSLRNGECEMALAGGVNLILDPDVSVYLSRARALAPDGKCKTFDAKADGYVRGEGCGVVVLKRLSDAERDGDNVLGLIRGSAVNHDGRSSGITVPNGPAQQEVIRAAHAVAGITGEDVGYVECHGTGTGLGDPIEVGALAAVLGDREMVLGTLKSNIGHLEAASGIAGLIKAVLCCERGAIPPNLHFELKNPHITAPIDVPTSTRAWDADERIAGVSSFGLSGTNAHIVVSSVAEVELETASAEGPFVLPLSAHSAQALGQLVDAVLAALETHDVTDVARTLAGRASLPFRLCPTGSATQVRAALAGARPAEVEAVPREAPEVRLGAGSPPMLLSAAFLSGAAVDWKTHIHSGQLITLVNTPFQRKRHWLEVAAAAPAVASAPVVAVSSEPLLGEQLVLPLVDSVVFEAKHRPASPVWLDHHRLFGRVVTPGAAHVALALAAARKSRGVTSASVTDVSFKRALILEDDEVRTVQCVLSGSKGDVDFKIASVLGGSAQVHAMGSLSAEAADVGAPTELLSDIQARLSTTGDPAAFYEEFASVGYTLGAAFRWMGETWRTDGEALCRMPVPAPDIGLGDAPLHPGLIDSCFQLLTRCLPEAQVAEVLDGTAIFVPAGIDRFTWLGDASGELWAHAKLSGPQSADIWLVDADGGVHARIEGLRVARIPATLLGGSPPAPDDVYQVRWLPMALVDEERGNPSGFDVLGAGETAEALRAELTRRGHVVSGGNTVVDLGSRQAAGVDGVNALLEVVRGMPERGKRLVIVTRGAAGLAGEGPSLEEAALLGLHRVIAMERTGLRATSIDLDPNLPMGAVDALADELEAATDADQVALRLSGRSVARLMERTEKGAVACSRWTVEVPGTLESVKSQPAARVEPGAGKVEIAVEATGLNFRDVLGALGAYPGDPGPLGGEAAGVVSAVGAGVSTVAVGDRVVCLLADSGCFRTHAVSDARFVAKLPDTLAFTAAATLPVAYATAAHGLQSLAGLKAGETVLIHAASGGVGMAAVQIAQRVGATIIGTAGSDAKRQVLRELGVQHVFNSRDLEYVASVQEMGGVDVVLNSLGAEHIAACLELTRAGGRFVEIGKADVLDAARRAALGFEYFHFDLVTMSTDEPETIHALLVDAMDRFARGDFHALPVREFTLEDTVGAFRHMARARQVGKVVIRWPAPARKAPIRSDAAYLVTGGLGALGLELATWLVDQGAGHLVLLGRSGPSPAATELLAGLRASGTRIDVVSVDVTDKAALGAAVSGLELAGVFHCAGVLDDALIAEQSPQRVARVAGVKTTGAWNLH
ncbi:MAG: SDR family NAD(P)-dependent oxidoreductase, partial [Proteobacteria bacterium]|nr:SDR family NAD(P)-dependent oxidoreductase [Pseudomonadota bacterium]